jgi:membrane protein
VAAGPDAFDRLQRRADGVERRVLGHNPAALVVRSARRFVDVRVTGLAAEMTYYTILSLLPLLTGLGAGLGILERIVGTDTVQDLEEAVIDGIAGILSADLVDDVAAPLVEELLRQERAGVAISGLVLSVWLASRVFRAAIRALDDAYEVAERRTLVQQWMLSLAFTAGAFVMVTVVLTLLVVGPLLGGGRAIAEDVGAGAAFEWFWSIGRWPAVGLVSVAFLTWLYRAGPNVDNTWRSCLPGALVATSGVVAVAVGFRAYVQLAGPQTPEVGTGDQAVAVAAQLVGVLAATLLFVWLSNVVLLVGGVVNAEWARTAADPPDPEAAAGEEEATG